MKQVHGVNVFSVAELLDYVETPEVKRAYEFGEKQFRKGYHHAILDVIDALREGVLPRQFLQYENTVHRWHYGGNYDEYPPPPKMPEAWSLVAKRILQRDKHVCHYCGEYADTVDHKEPVRFGGTDEESNLVASCRSCNSRKHTMPYETFRQRGRL